ncbi:hypothetical protein G7066_12860 [Leucobacter coleopterorum]|uniref:Uncharacterized protein n=1 Tax=Leucobacter coleopterorum TaxID=2714933 RepID=A0ABX6JXG9_9MICO|nr:hypothetical protein [Leucobacter coleopterorum]QIM17490.1 hypothetical protein G7066_12860 [Leucobacter coleopterorum]
MTADRKPRRVIRPAPEGVDPNPSDHSLDATASEDRPEGWGESGAVSGSRKPGENDEQLRRDRPPHWG